MTVPDHVRRAVAGAFLAGEWSVLGLRASGAELFDQRVRWLDPVIRAALRAHPQPPLDARDGFARFLAPHLERVLVRLERRTLPPIRRRRVAAPAMAAHARWPVPALATTADLARWLGLSPEQLDWFTDRRGTAARSPRAALRHYRETWLAKRSGGRRLLEIPRPRMRSIQRQILDRILSAIPPHGAALGFRRGHSALDHASLHAGRDVLIRLDLEDFFPSTPAGRIYGIFRGAGYPEEVARALTGLTTRRASPEALHALQRSGSPESNGTLATRSSESWRAARRLSTPHLPQGAPTSPGLANLAAFRLDVRLASLAARIGARYSRYADDLAFSGDHALARAAESLIPRIAAIALEEGYRPNVRKTRITRAGARQELMGLTINRRPGVPRREREHLRAILTNCVRHGPSTQNRADHADFRAHLEGRVAWVGCVNEAHATRLRALLATIDWTR